ncbi:MAG: orotidine-5'-phosphate decarboxylase [Solirubrobacteraceae bacterium]
MADDARRDADSAPAPSFGDRLAERVQARRSQLVLGLDPDPARLWPRALELAERGGGGVGGLERGPAIVRVIRGARASIAFPSSGGPAERAARAVAAHCRLLIEAAGEHCVAVKPQLACFERLGAPGWAALREVVDDAAERGLLVIADAKRGDIDISARAYGQAFFGGVDTPFGRVDGLGVDALTVSPLLGRDSLAPLVQAARGHAAGLLVLVRTSNPGAADLQDRRLAEGGTVSEVLARIVHELGQPGIGRSGLADIGAVTGATAPERLQALRDLMPSAFLLLPGIGPQGGSGRDLAPAFAPGPAGGLVSASRAIVYAFAQARPPNSATRGDLGGGGPDPAQAARAEASRLRELVWDLYA